MFEGDSSLITIGTTDAGFNSCDTVYFRHAAYNSFSKDVGDLNLAGEDSATILAESVGVPSGPPLPPSPDVGDTLYNTTTNRFVHVGWFELGSSWYRNC